LFVVQTAGFVVQLLRIYVVQESQLITVVTVSLDAVIPDTTAGVEILLKFIHIVYSISIELGDVSSV